MVRSEEHWKSAWEKPTDDAMTDSPSTQDEPEAGTIGTIVPATDSRTGTARTIFQ